MTIRSSDIADLNYNMYQQSNTLSDTEYQTIIHVLRNAQSLGQREYRYLTLRVVRELLHDRTKSFGVLRVLASRLTHSGYTVQQASTDGTNRQSSVCLNISWR